VAGARRPDDGGSARVRPGAAPPAARAGSPERGPSASVRAQASSPGGLGDASADQRLAALAARGRVLARLLLACLAREAEGQGAAAGSRGMTGGGWREERARRAGAAPGEKARGPGGATD
jgi:hypothetical protein